MIPRGLSISKKLRYPQPRKTQKCVLPKFAQICATWKPISTPATSMHLYACMGRVLVGVMVRLSRVGQCIRLNKHDSTTVPPLKWSIKFAQIRAMDADGNARALVVCLYNMGRVLAGVRVRVRLGRVGQWYNSKL